MSQEIADALARAGGGGGERREAGRIRDYDGQTVTVVSIKTVPNKRFTNQGDSVIATGFNAAGEEVDFWTTPGSGKQLLEVQANLPLDLRVTSYDTEYGNKGFKFELA